MIGLTVGIATIDQITIVIIDMTTDIRMERDQVRTISKGNISIITRITMKREITIIIMTIILIIIIMIT